MINRIVILGSGHVAWQLGRTLKSAGLEIDAVWSRTAENGEALSRALGCPFISDLKSLPKTDLILVAVKDDAIGTLDLMHVSATVAHTSGSKGISIIKAKKRAVFYPLQTIQKNMEMDWRSVPICIEAGSSKLEEEMMELGKKISERVYKVNSEQREQIHVAAVFACNFSNYLFGIAEEILNNSNLPFEILFPLIEKTVENARWQSPMKNQTGPAARKDVNTVEKQIQNLSSHPDWQNIYHAISQSILKQHEA